MATTPNKPERYQRSTNQHLQIMFLQIVIVAKRELRHRDPSVFAAERIEPVTHSLVQEGCATSLVVYDTGKTTLVNDQQSKLYGLVSGHRRHEAMKKAIEDNLDPERFHDRMEVPVVLMVPGEDQSEESFHQDLLARSVLENEQRLKHSQTERLAIVAQFEAAKMPKPRAASALAISTTQYERDVRIVRLPWLHGAVKKQQIGATDAATLAETAEKKNRLEQFRREFAIWVSEKESQLERERTEQKKLGRELKGAAAQIKKYLDGATVKAWVKALNEGTSLIDTAGDFTFGVVVDDDKKTIEISRVNQPFDKLTSADLKTMIAEMQLGVRKLVPVMRSLQVREQAVEVTPEEIEAELARVQEEARLAAEQRAQEEAGRTPELAEADGEPTQEDIGDAIDEAINAVGGSGDGDGERNGNRDDEDERRD